MNNSNVKISTMVAKSLDIFWRVCVGKLSFVSSTAFKSFQIIRMHRKTVAKGNQNSILKSHTHEEKKKQLSCGCLVRF